MDRKIIYLDLEKVTLIGWEWQKSDLMIDSIVRGIERGCEFPPVPIVRRDENTYLLTTWTRENLGRMDGGHHRAVAHFIAKEPLKCVLIGDESEYNASGVLMSRNVLNMDIRNIVLFDDREEIFSIKKKNDENYI